MKLLIILAFFGIVLSLGSALVSLNRRGGTNDRGVVKALSWRIGLSIALFLFIMFAYLMGWVRPHGVGG